MSTQVAQRNETRIADWIGDIVALESHVEEAMDKQLKLKSDNAELTASLKKFHDAVRDSKKRAVAFQDELGKTTAGNPIIKTASTILGKAAGLVDLVRDDSIAKSLRDDYTAYNLLAISYTMLHTTTMALDDKKTMAFAEQGLTTYAGLVQDINRLIPVAVLEDLKKNSEYNVQDTTVIEGCRKFIDKTWKITSN